MTINKLAKLENNYLDSNLEYTTNKSEKIDFTSCLKKSIDFIESTTDVDSMMQAANIVHARFTKAYNKYPIFLKTTSLFCRIIGRATLHQYYDEFITKINSQIAKNYNGSLKGFLEKTYPYIKETKNPNKDLLPAPHNFLDQSIFTIAGTVAEDLKEKVDSKGVLYEITNQFNCQSYLIGLLHHYPSSGIPDAIFEKIDKSKRLITELKLFDIPINFDLMDYALARRAVIQHSVMAEGLETKLLQENKLLSVQEELKKDPNIPVNYVSKLSEKKKNILIERRLQDPHFLLLQQQEAWKKGDIDDLKLVTNIQAPPELQNLIVKERNAQWLTNTDINLLDTLQNTKETISIAVGAGHLFGKTGLLKAFQDTGTLQVQKIG